MMGVLVCVDDLRLVSQTCRTVQWCPL